MSKAIAYILNPEKTDEKLLVSSYGCASETAAREFEWTRKIAEQKGMNPVRIIARHVIQSFEIGEVTPELAHEIGKQFADEILGGKYEYVLTTHIDKDHVHNHLIFNAVDFVNYHAYKSYKRIYYDMREVSDRLCKENGLSVIPPSQNKGCAVRKAAHRPWLQMYGIYEFPREAGTEGGRRGCGYLRRSGVFRYQKRTA